MTPQVEFGDPRVPAYLWPHVRVAASGCWEWTGRKEPNGYGDVYLRRDLLRQTRLRRHQRAHRVFYALLVAPIQNGTAMHVDHLCRNRICCNPAHLEYVPAAVNISRAVHRKSSQTHCHRGHDIMDPDNVKIRIRNGHPNRRCRQCLVLDSRIANAIAQERKRAARAAA